MADPVQQRPKRSVEQKQLWKEDQHCCAKCPTTFKSSDPRIRLKCSHQLCPSCFEKLRFREKNGILKPLRCPLFYCKERDASYIASGCFCSSCNQRQNPNMFLVCRDCDSFFCKRCADRHKDHNKTKWSSVVALSTCLQHWDDALGHINRIHHHERFKFEKLKLFYEDALIEPMIRLLRPILENSISRVLNRFDVNIETFYNETIRLFEERKAKVNGFLVGESKKRYNIPEDHQKLEEMKSEDHDVREFFVQDNFLDNVFVKSEFERDNRNFEDIPLLPLPPLLRRREAVEIVTDKISEELPKTLDKVNEELVECIRNVLEDMVQKKGFFDECDEDGMAGFDYQGPGPSWRPSGTTSEKLQSDAVIVEPDSDSENSEDEEDMDVVIVSDSDHPSEMPRPSRRSTESPEAGSPEFGGTPVGTVEVPGSPEIPISPEIPQHSPDSDGLLSTLTNNDRPSTIDEGSSGDSAISALVERENQDFELQASESNGVSDSSEHPFIVGDVQSCRRGSTGQGAISPISEGSSVVFDQVGEPEAHENQYLAKIERIPAAEVRSVGKSDASVGKPDASVGKASFSLKKQFEMKLQEICEKDASSWKQKMSVIKLGGISIDRQDFCQNDVECQTEPPKVRKTPVFKEATSQTERKVVTIETQTEMPQLESSKMQTEDVQFAVHKFLRVGCCQTEQKLLQFNSSQTDEKWPNSPATTTAETCQSSGETGEITDTKTAPKKAENFDSKQVKNGAQSTKKSASKVESIVKSVKSEKSATAAAPFVLMSSALEAESISDEEIPPVVSTRMGPPCQHLGPPLPTLVKTEAMSENDPFDLSNSESESESRAKIQKLDMADISSCPKQKKKAKSKSAPKSGKKSPVFKPEPETPAIFELSRLPSRNFGVSRPFSVRNWNEKLEKIAPENSNSPGIIVDAISVIRHDEIYAVTPLIATKGFVFSSGKLKFAWSLCNCSKFEEIVAAMPPEAIDFFQNATLLKLASTAKRVFALSSSQILVFFGFDQFGYVSYESHVQLPLGFSKVLEISACEIDESVRLLTEKSVFVARKGEGKSSTPQLAEEARIEDFCENAVFKDLCHVRNLVVLAISSRKEKIQSKVVIVALENQEPPVILYQLILAEISNPKLCSVQDLLILAGFKVENDLALFKCEFPAPHPTENADNFVKNRGKSRKRKANQPGVATPVLISKVGNEKILDLELRGYLRQGFRCKPGSLAACAGNIVCLPSPATSEPKWVKFDENLGLDANI